MSSRLVGLYSVCSCLLITIVYWYLVRRFVATPPIYDEIWKLDVATSPSTWDRITTLHTPLAPGWAFLAKAVLWPWPAPFQVVVARCFAAVWILPVIVLAPFCLARRDHHETDVIVLLAGGVFLGLAQPVQSALTYLNPYLFEVAYAVALLVLGARWDELGRRGRLMVLALLAVTPLFSFSPLFYLPGLYTTLLWRTTEVRWRILVGASAVVAIGLAAVLAAFVYVAMKSSNLGALQTFWGSALVQGSPAGLLKAVGRFPGELASSLLPLRIMPVGGDAAGHGLLVAIWGLILLGFQTLWRADRRYVGWVLSAAAIAGVVAYLKPWPLTFLTPLNRVNLAWLWPWYFAFGVGVARALAALLPCFWGRRPVVFFVLFFAAWPMIAPYGVPDDPSREIFTDILNTVRPDESGPVLVFPLHYSTVPYANYLLANRWPGRFAVVEIDQQTPAATYVEKIPAVLAARKDVVEAWIIVPCFLVKDPIMQEIEGLSLPGFKLAQVTDTRASQIRKYRAVR